MTIYIYEKNHLASQTGPQLAKSVTCYLLPGYGLGARSEKHNQAMMMMIMQVSLCNLSPYEWMTIVKQPRTDRVVDLDSLVMGERRHCLYVSRDRVFVCVCVPVPGVAFIKAARSTTICSVRLWTLRIIVKCGGLDRAGTGSAHRREQSSQARSARTVSHNKRNKWCQNKNRNRNSKNTKQQNKIQNKSENAGQREFCHYTASLQEVYI